MNDAKATGSPVLHSIGFDISAEPDQGATVLVDGRPLPLPTDRGFLGFRPQELFGADLPLLAEPRPKRVAIAQCSCGVTECDNITPIVELGGDDQQWVVWRDFRSLGSAVSSPSSIDPDAELHLEHDRRDDQIVFDRVQYEAAVLAASADRSWETAARATARLLEGLLATDAGVFRSLGLVLTWVAPSWERSDRWTVSLEVPWPYRTEAQRRADVAAERAARPVGERRTTASFLVGSDLRVRPWEREPGQVLLELTTPPASPIDQAADLYRQLTAVPLADWAGTFPHHDMRGR